MTQRRALWTMALPFLAATVIWSCGQGSEEQPADAPAADTLASSEEEADFDIVLPSPLQIARIFQRAGLTYTGGIVNPVEKVSTYSTNLSQTLNFGVYSADLAYLVLNNQPQEALTHMKAVKQLSETIGLSAIFNDNKLIESFEINIGEEDTMINILVQVQERMNEALQDNDQEYMSAVIFAGAWIEGMYIGSKVASKNDNAQISNRIVEQMTILSNLIRGLELHPARTSEVDALIADLDGVRSLFRNFDSVKAMGDEEEYDITDLTITESEQQALSARIVDIRNGLVNG